MKNTDMDTCRVMSKGLELLRSSGDLEHETSAGFVTSTRHIQMIRSSRPDGRWVGCLLGVRVPGSVTRGQLLSPFA